MAKTTPGETKINVDASFGRRGVSEGLVARDEAGEILWMWRSAITAATVLEAEMAGVYLAILMAKFRNVQRLVVEGDNKQIMEGLDTRMGVRTGAYNPSLIRYKPLQVRLLCLNVIGYLEG